MVLTYEYSSSAAVTTSSAVDVVLDGMTTGSLGAGNYFVTFSGSVSNNTADKQGSVSIYIDGIQVPHSVREELGAANRKRCLATQAAGFGVTGGLIEVRWNVLPGSIGMFTERSMYVIKYSN